MFDVTLRLDGKTISVLFSGYSMEQAREAALNYLSSVELRPGHSVVISRVRTVTTEDTLVTYGG